MRLRVLQGREHIWHAVKVSTQSVIVWFIGKSQGGKVLGNGLQSICSARNNPDWSMGVPMVTKPG